MPALPFPPEPSTQRSGQRALFARPGSRVPNAGPGQSRQAARDGWLNRPQSSSASFNSSFFGGTPSPTLEPWSSQSTPSSGETPQRPRIRRAAGGRARSRR